MARGFKLLDKELGVPQPGSHLWTIIDVSYGHATDWRLRVVLESDEQRGVIVWFENPTSHRVLDERDLLGYWDRRKAENVDMGSLYSIRESPFLDDLADGVSTQTLGEGKSLTHYLIAGMDTCVEVIAQTPPDFINADHMASTDAVKS